jgi:hypothetical protein
MWNMIFYDYEYTTDLDCPNMSITTDTNLFLHLGKKIT